jgi:hypothetical protein
VGTTTQTFSGPFSISGVLGALVGGSNATITYTGLATSSNIGISQILYGTSASGVASVATTSLTANNGLSVTGTLGALIGGSNSTIGLAAIAANSILANQTGGSAVPTALSTSSLGIALGDTTGTLPTTRGGTNITTYTTGDTLYASATNVLSKLAAGSGGQVLAMVNGIPGWVATTTLSTISGTLNLATQVTGTLGVSNGGTGQTSFGQGWLGINDAGSFISSTSPTVNYVTATSTATSC